MKKLENLIKEIEELKSNVSKWYVMDDEPYLRHSQGSITEDDLNFISRARTLLPKCGAALKKAKEALEFYESGRMLYGDFLKTTGEPGRMAESLDEGRTAKQALKEIEEVLGGNT